MRVVFASIPFHLRNQRVLGQVTGDRLLSYFYLRDMPAGWLDHFIITGEALSTLDKPRKDKRTLYTNAHRRVGMFRRLAEYEKRDPE